MSAAQTSPGSVLSRGQDTSPQLPAGATPADPSAATLGSAVEEWRAIPSADGYEASNLGAIRSLRPWREPRLLNPDLTGNRRYFAARLVVDGKKVKRRVHLLVLEAFIGPRPEGMVTRHLNGDAFDNRLSNLAYGTQSENGFDAVAHGKNSWANRTHCGKGHPLSGDNLERRSNKPNARQCRTCRREWDRAGRERRRRAA